MSKLGNLYIGRAGHLAAIAEFLSRGWNAAIPEVDVGDDVFVVRDSDGDLRRVQVKTSRAKLRQKGWSALFSLSRQQVVTGVTPELYYVFVVRFKEKWENFVVVSRVTLADEHLLNDVGHVRGSLLTLYLTWDGVQLKCKTWDMTRFMDSWTAFPEITH